VTGSITVSTKLAHTLH